MARRMVALEGNEAAASAAHRLSEVIAIYPITPSSPMGEFADEWSARGRRNIWGAIPDVVQMQSEGGAAAAVHGAIQTGSLATTFTASQGLLLMIPTMYKIAGEFTPFCMHVTARTLATHALSIFGDHSDVMACRQTGFAMLASNSVQEAHDMACIAHLATLESRIPFLHFFDGFRTSHEVNTIEELTDEELRELTDEELVRAFRARALTPDAPVLRGTAQNPDTFFQAREAGNLFYERCPGIVQSVMDRFAKLTGRQYRLFEYFGDAEAERVVVLMGSAVDTARQTARYLMENGQKVGVLAVRLYRPFSMSDLVAGLPASVKAIAVLDRTKEPGAPADPLYLDVVTALHEARQAGVWPAGHEVRVVAGRYGLSSKEFTPAMVKAVFDELAREQPSSRFTVGIVDDVTHLSLPVDDTLDIEGDDVVRALFYGLGADGTVGANKNSIKIIGEQSGQHAQGYFVYDSKKAGAITISHLRFGPRPIHSPYLIRRASFVACHQFSFLERYEMLTPAAPGGVFLLNAPVPPDRVWDSLPREVQEEILEKQLRFYVIDAYKVANAAGLGGRINTIMQTCFFAIAGVLPPGEEIKRIKDTIRKTYEKKGDEVVRRNCAAVDETLAHLHEVTVPQRVTASRGRPAAVPHEAPDFVKRVTAAMMAGHGDLLPVSAFPVDGTWPTATCQWEKRNIALEIPVWDSELCIQCNKCAMVCPHAAIRAKVYEPELLAGAPAAFRSMDYKAKEFRGQKYTLQVAPEDCTGCKLCVNVCPAKDKSDPKRKAINMEPQAPLREKERENYRFFLDLPEVDRTAVARIDVKGSQLFQPLFEYSGACAGCGETPYIKLLTQLFGDRMLIANATGCSSIYGGNLPTTPYTVNAEGRGPAWCNSLFEDNAEFGLGYRLSLDAHREHVRELIHRLGLEDDLTSQLLSAPQKSDQEIIAQRKRVAALRARLSEFDSPEARRLEQLADYLVKKSVWIVGGDGWAYDIGYGGLDHVLSMQRDVNILVMDTEVYSNTGGQSSKATPLGAAAKFASAGKSMPKKDLGLMAMSYGHVYVASIAFGAKDNHTVQALMEADSYPGPSLVICYSHCIAHGYDMALALNQQKLAADSGAWPLYRYDPRRAEGGEAPLILETPSGKATLEEYMRNEARFRMVEKMDPHRFRNLAVAARAASQRKMATWEHMARLALPRKQEGDGNGNGHVTSGAGSVEPLADELGSAKGGK